MSDHSHLWLRSPVTDCTVTYRCRDCSESHKVIWLQMIGSVSEMDSLVQKNYGGLTHGEDGFREGNYVPPFLFSLSGRILQLMNTGLFLCTEDLMNEDPDE